MAWDVIVVGAGAAGSAAAFELATRGKRVLLLEQFGVGHEQGSSHGLTRIIRLAYFEHPSYVPLLRRAYERWRELESASGRKLLHITGSIDAGDADSRTVRGSLHSCAVHGLEHEVLTSAELSVRYPGYALPAGHTAVFQPEGGFLIPEACIEAHVALARAAGAEVRTEEKVVSLAATPGGNVVVETLTARFEAGQAVVAAGAWLPTLFPQLAPVVQPERQVLAWFAISDRDAFAPSRFPVFNLDHAGEHWYGFPEFGVPGFKVGCYNHLRERADPDTLDRSEVGSRDIDLLRRVVTDCFPAADGEVLMSRVCMFTNTPDEHFILDRHPDLPQVVLASPCSGHGFKFASVVGEIVADLVERDSTSHDISLHRLSRFPPISRSAD
jgi:sarcosine oxidase